MSRLILSLRPGVAGCRSIYSYGVLLILLLVGVVEPCSADAPKRELILGESSSTYSVGAHSQSGQIDFFLRLRPEVRSVAFRVSAPRDATPETNAPITAQLHHVAPKIESRGPIFAGQVIPNPDLMGAQRLFRVLTGNVTLTPRSEERIWVLRISTPPPADGANAIPLHINVLIEADARVITDREKALMAWRARINPLANPDAVREKIQELTDEEVRYYTAFNNKENFLMWWGRKPNPEFQTPDGVGFKLTPETRGLFLLGNPLPNGQYLHR